MRKRTHKKNFWFNDEEENRIKELCNKSGMNESDIVRNLIMGNDIKRMLQVISFMRLLEI